MNIKSIYNALRLHVLHDHSQASRLLDFVTLTFQCSIHRNTNGDRPLLSVQGDPKLPDDSGEEPKIKVDPRPR